MSTEQDKARAVPNQPLSSAIGYAAAVLRAHADKLPLPSHAKALADRCQEASNLLANTAQGDGVQPYVPPFASIDYYRAQVVMLADALEMVAQHVGTMQREGSADFHAGTAAVMKDCLPVFQQVGMQDDGDGFGFDRAADETINNASDCWGFRKAMRRLTPLWEVS